MFQDVFGSVVVDLCVVSSGYFPVQQNMVCINQFSHTEGTANLQHLVEEASVVNSLS